MGEIIFEKNKRAAQMMALRELIRQRDPRQVDAEKIDSGKVDSRKVDSGRLPARKSTGHAPPPAQERGISFNDAMMQALLTGRKSQTRRLVGRTDLILRGAGKRAVLINEFGRELICPHGRAGHILWVRERWAKVKNRHVYAADANHGLRVSWRPGFHMPRCASRITLRVLSAFPQRLQSITAADARAEGCPNDERSPRQWFRRLWDSIYCKPGLSWDDNPWVWVIRFERSL